MPPIFLTPKIKLFLKPLRFNQILKCADLNGYHNYFKIIKSLKLHIIDSCYASLGAQPPRLSMHDVHCGYKKSDGKQQNLMVKNE